MKKILAEHIEAGESPDLLPKALPLIQHVTRARQGLNSPWVRPRVCRKKVRREELTRSMGTGDSVD